MVAQMVENLVELMETLSERRLDSMKGLRLVVSMASRKAVRWVDLLGS